MNWKYLDASSHRQLDTLAHRDRGNLPVSCQNSRCPERRSNPQTPAHRTAVSLIHQYCCTVVLPRAIFYTRPSASPHCSICCGLQKNCPFSQAFQQTAISTPIWNLTLYFICECRRHFSALLSFELNAISITESSTQHAETIPLNTEFHMPRPANIAWPCVCSFASTQELQQPPNSIHQSPGTKRVSATQEVPPHFRGPEIWYRF
jgi:hypothetical protein